jgi:hypothetical protein
MFEQGQRLTAYDRRFPLPDDLVLSAQQFYSTIFWWLAAAGKHLCS